MPVVMVWLLNEETNTMKNRYRQTYVKHTYDSEGGFFHSCSGDWLQRTTFRTFAILLLLSFHFWSIAQPSVQVDRPTAKYQVGETAHFLISSSVPGTVSYTIEYDRFSTDIQSGSVNINAGNTHQLPFTLNEAGVIHCIVEQGGTTSKASAVFAPFSIDALEAEPADFDHFWEMAKSELASVPIDPQLSLHSSTNYSTTYRINLASVQNRRVYGYISVPTGPGPFPAILSLPSYGTAANITNPADFIAERGGALSMTISIHNSDPTQEDPSAYEPNEITDPHQMYFKLAVQACIRAVDYIFSRPDFDGESLGVTGVSQGGGLALMLGGVDERVKLLTLSNPTHCEHVGLRHERASGFPYYIRKSRNEVGTSVHEEATANASKYFDAIYFAKRFKGPSLSIICYEDEICPPATTLSAYNQLQDMKVLLHARDLDHNHPNEYWDGRFDFYRQFFPAMRTPPWPWPGTTTGYLVEAGMDQTITLGNAIQLNGSVQKDGLALGSLPVRWEKVSGPGTINFSAPGSYQTTASFSQKGTYVIRFAADDFEKLTTEAKYYTAADHVTITVEDNSSGDVTPPSVILSTGQANVNSPFEVNISFSEPVNGFAIDDLLVTNGTTSNLTGSGLSYQVMVNPIFDGSVSIRLPANRLQDLANNQNLASNTLIVNYTAPDLTPPAVSLSTAATDVNGPFEVNLAFSEQVNGFEQSDITLSNGQLSNLSGSGLNYTFTVSPITDGQVQIQLPANQVTDLAGNTNLASNVLVVNYTALDITPPSVQLSTASTNVNGPFIVNLTLNEAVTGLELTDVIVSNGLATSLNGSGLNYEIQIVPGIDGIIEISIPANRFEDLAANPNLASNILVVNYIAPDITPPTIQLSTPLSSVTTVFEVFVTFSEAVTGFRPG